jgi:hypothetical protein
VTRTIRTPRTTRTTKARPAARAKPKPGARSTARAKAAAPRKAPPGKAPPGKAPPRKAPPGKAPPGKAPSLDPARAARLLAKVRELCLALPGVTERPSHGSPSFFIGGKHAFASFSDNHHHDGRLALVCCAPPGAQAMLVDANPDGYYVPPYVGHLGWIGVRLDRDLPWREIAAVLDSAHAARQGRAP